MVIYMTKNVGIMGGTFNPIHNAHLRMADFVLDEFGFEKIVFVPAYNPPHKNIAPQITAARAAVV